MPYYCLWVRWQKKYYISVPLDNMDEMIDIQCLPAKLHNTPQQIPALLQEKIRHYKKHYDHILLDLPIVERADYYKKCVWKKVLNI